MNVLVQVFYLYRDILWSKWNWITFANFTITQHILNLDNINSKAMISEHCPLIVQNNLKI